jgi:hypothetical protein
MAMTVWTYGIIDKTDQGFDPFHQDYKFNFKNIYGSTVYIKTCHLDWFFKKILFQFKNPIVLVSGAHFYHVPHHCKFFVEILNHKNIITWFAQNYSGISMNKIRHLPLGLDFHTLYFKEKKEWGNKMSPFEQENQLFDIMNSLIPIEYTDPSIVLVNFHKTANIPPDFRRRIRSKILSQIKDNPCFRFLPNQKRIDFWRECNTYSFIASPIGQGLDTHRTYEILCLRRIPILCQCGINPLFDNLPAVIVDDWTKINPSFLRDNFHKIIKNWHHYDWKKLELSYWSNMINSYKKDFI